MSAPPPPAHAPDTCCQMPQPEVLFTPDQTTPYDALMKKHWPVYAPLHVHCESEHLVQEVRQLLRCRCTVCGHVDNEQSTAMRHLRDQHPTLRTCHVCLNYRKVFFHEHKLYTVSALSRHMREGDKDDAAFRGHPECQFCRRHYYSGDELYNHLELDHYHCFLCRHKGKFNAYYKDYDDVVRPGARVATLSGRVLKLTSWFVSARAIPTLPCRRDTLRRSTTCASTRNAAVRSSPSRPRSPCKHMRYTATKVVPRPPPPPPAPLLALVCSLWCLRGRRATGNTGRLI